MSKPPLPPALKQDLMFLLLQYLDEEKYQQTLHKFEQESRSRFNMNYFEETLLGGDWDEAERYLSGFTKLDDNIHSTKTYLEMRKQKYLETLDQNDMAKAAEILKKELKMFATLDADHYKDLIKLLTVYKFREKELVDTIAERTKLTAQLKELIEANPVFLGKLEIPVLEKSRLRALINQSLNLQHSVCKRPKKEAGDLTLYTNHTCDAAPAATSVPMPFPPAATPPRANVLPVRMAFPTAAVNTLRAPVLANQGHHLLSFPPTATAPNVSALAGTMANATAYTNHTCDAAPAKNSVPPPVAKSATYAPRPIRAPTTAPRVVNTLRAPVLANQGQHFRPFPPAATAPRVVNTLRAPVLANQGQHFRPFPPAATAPRVVNTLRAPVLANQGQHFWPFPPAATAPNVSALAGTMANATASTIVRPAVVAALPEPRRVNQVSMLKHPRTLENASNNQSTEHGHLMKRLRSSGQPITDEAADPIEREPQWSMDDLPRTLVWTFRLESCVTSLDFHPSRHTLILAGSTEGEIGLWEIGSRRRLVSKSFKIWNMEVCSAPCKASFHKDPTVSITRITWSPSGNYVGVAYTKHLIHLYGFQRNDLHQRVEIDAHIGRVNDLAFANVEEQLYVVSCGDDKQIKVWAITGQKIYTFEGHDAPVYSVCAHHIEGIPIVLSFAADGIIKIWRYDNLGSRGDISAPGNYCTKMMYSADGKRMFSCGTGKDGIPYLVEWDETEGEIKRKYSGFTTKVAGVVQFDMAHNLFLAAGESHQVKFWNMNHPKLLCSIGNDDVQAADGLLPSRPCLRFNKEGNFLAVSTVHSGFKILANAEGMRSLKALGHFFALRGQNSAAFCN